MAIKEIWIQKKHKSSYQFPFFAWGKIGVEIRDNAMVWSK